MDEEDEKLMDSHIKEFRGGTMIEEANTKGNLIENKPNRLIQSVAYKKQETGNFK